MWSEVIRNTRAKVLCRLLQLAWLEGGELQAESLRGQSAIGVKSASTVNPISFCKPVGLARLWERRR